MHVTFAMFIMFRVAVEIKVFLAIKDLREEREIKEKRVHQDLQEKEYVTFVAVLQQSIHCPTWNSSRNGYSLFAHDIIIF